MHKKALGRGLETLIPVGSSGGGRHEPSEVVELALALITPNPYQPRHTFDDAGLQELADSIKTQGVIQPVLVRRLGDGQYQLIAGERRLRAAKLAGLPKIPALLRPATDAEAMEMALIENLQRKDLNPLEAARAYHRLMKEFGLTQEDLARQLGKDRSTIANSTRLLSLPAEVQAWVAEEQLSLGHAKVLLALASPEQQIALGRRVLAEQLSVRDLERLTRSSPRSRPGGPVVTRAGTELEERLQRRLGTPVRIVAGKVGGRIMIQYYSAEDRERILDVLLG